jgi:Na+-driven multidrug efflux pump
MFSLPLKGLSMTALAPIRAAGDTRFSLWMGVLSGCLSMAGLWLGIAVCHFGLWAIPLAWGIAWSARSAFTWSRFRAGAWRYRKLAA